MLTRLTLAMVLRSAIASGQVTERVEVSITNVDLVVTDASGNAVSGLTSDEFEIREGNHPREITHFVEVSGEATVSPARVQPPPRSILLLLDNTWLRPDRSFLTAKMIARRTVDIKAAAVLPSKFQIFLGRARRLV